MFLASKIRKKTRILFFVRQALGKWKTFTYMSHPYSRLKL
jgi:hypothetical protein